MKIGDFFIALGFDVDEKKLKSFDEGLKSVKGNMVAVTAATAAALYTLNRFFNEGVKTATSLKNFTEQTGFAKDAVYEFFNIARHANTEFTLDDAIASWTKLGQVIAGIKRGEFPEGAMWQNFGLSADDTPESVINKIRAAMPRLLETTYKGSNGKPDLVLLAKDLETMGLDKAMQALLLPDDKWMKYSQDWKPSEKQLKTMENLASAYSDFSQDWLKFKLELGEEIAPYFVDFINWAGKSALPVLREVISGFIKWAAEVLNIQHNYEEIIRLAPQAWEIMMDRLEQEIDKFIKRLLGIDSEDGDKSYSQFRFKDNNYTQLPDFLNSDFERIMGGNLNPSISGDRELMRMLANNQAAIAAKMGGSVSTTNHLSIHSTATASDLADTLEGTLDRMAQRSSRDGLYGASGNVNSGDGF
jgi:hypothetical protein